MIIVSAVIIVIKTQAVISWQSSNLDVYNVGCVRSVLVCVQQQVRTDLTHPLLPDCHLPSELNEMGNALQVGEE